MQLAILVGTNPKLANSSARIRLRKGMWSLVHEGLNDSIFDLHVLSPHAELEDKHITYELRGSDFPFELMLVSNTMIFITWKYRGTEKAINLSAHIKNGT